MNGKDRLSPHLTYNELIRSETARRLGIKNIPNQEQLENFKYWAKVIFEPLRERVNSPIFCSSLFRTEEVNKRTPNSSPTSAHMGLNGMAAGDLDNDGFIDWANNRRIFECAIKLPLFDQIIWEYGDEEKPDWVHIGINRFKNRFQILRSVRKGDGVKYLDLTYKYRNV